jgi:hypothetical protein
VSAVNRLLKRDWQKRFWSVLVDNWNKIIVILSKLQHLDGFSGLIFSLEIDAEKNVRDSWNRKIVFLIDLLLNQWHSWDCLQKYSWDVKGGLQKIKDFWETPTKKNEWLYQLQADFQLLINDVEQRCPTCCPPRLFQMPTGSVWNQSHWII